MQTLLKTRLVRRLLVLGLLLGCLGVASATPATVHRARLICCSACEADPPPLPCRHGCSPDC